MYLENPANGAPIKDVFNRVIYRHPVNAVRVYENETVAQALLEKYPFLKDVTSDKKYKDAVLELVETEEWLDSEDFGPDRRERREKRLKQEIEPDMERDPGSYYGAGLEEER